MLEIRRHQQGRAALVGEAIVLTVDALWEAALELADQEGQLTVDLSALDEIDLCGLQVLLALARAKGPDAIRFTGWPESIRRRVALCGLDELLVTGEDAHGSD